MVRGRITDPRTGKLEEVRMVLADEQDANAAFNTLHEEMDKVTAKRRKKSASRE